MEKIITNNIDPSLPPAEREPRQESETLSNSREKNSIFLNASQDVIEEMMKPEYDDIFPADIVAI